MDTANLSYLALAWLCYFALHSALASRRVKQWVALHLRGLSAYYRMAYNLIAVALLIPLLWLLHGIPAEPLWRWHGIWRWLMDGLALSALAGFVWSLRHYRMGEFLGLTQGEQRGQRPRFVISPLHRYVRHPWYSFGLVIIWTRDMDPAWLVSCVAITAYFALGSYWEEQKLETDFGEAYRRYRRRVPGLVPLPGRRLTPAEAAEIVAEANQA